MILGNHISSSIQRVLTKNHDLWTSGLRSLFVLYHGASQMRKNNQNPKNGIALLMGDRNGFQRILIPFLWHKMQETSPRAMLQAKKIE